MSEEQEDILMMDFLHQAYPGRTDQQILPIGLISMNTSISDNLFYI
jgi:hypothetical protein